MMPQTSDGQQPAVVTDARGAFSILLPGSWATIPIGDAVTMRAAARAIVRARMPRDDRLALARRQLQDELVAGARRAAQAHAVLYALSLEILPDVPFPASMVAFPQEWPGLVQAASRDPAGRLALAFPGAVAVDRASAPVIRRAVTGASTVGDASVPMLDLEYGVAEPSGALLCAMVSVPNCPAPDLVAQLFDAVIGSIFWPGGAAAGEETSHAGS